MTDKPFSKNDIATIEREYADLKESARRRCSSAEELELVQKAFEFANAVHAGVRRRSGEPYILHPIAVAKIVVVEIGLGHRSICAALLHDIFEDSNYTIEDIRLRFGDKISSLVEGLAKIKTVLDLEESDRMAGATETDETFKRILLTLNDDVRVVLIKLADRLDNCRTIEFKSEFKREKILSEIMYIFVPLAHRLGFYSIKSEMENIWLRFKEPESYDRITREISKLSRNQDKVLGDFLQPITQALDRDGYEYTVKKRVKTPYSIWNKIRNKHVSFDQISDFFAVRIVFKPTADNIQAERNDCFRIFSLITSLYDFRSDRTRDWVTFPKDNGYEALHLTAICPDGTNIEVQLRSQRMDAIAEKGIAAHWNYKESKDVGSEGERMLDEWLLKVKSLIESQEFNSPEHMARVHDELLEVGTVVLDNSGRQYSIPNSSTVLDFAFISNPDTAVRAIAAKINHSLCPLSALLHNGDQVEVIFSSKECPRPEWLQILKTAAAIDALSRHLGENSDTPSKQTGNEA